MRLIALSDIHGAYNKVDEILAQESSFDALIIAGDLTTVGSPEEAARAIRQFLRHGKPLFVVAGNMDVPEVETTFSTLGVSVNARGVVHEGVGIFGVSASPFTPMHTPYEISEDEIMTRAEAGWKDVASAQRKLFVPHAPPRETKVDRILLGKHRTVCSRCGDLRTHPRSARHRHDRYNNNRQLRSGWQRLLCRHRDRRGNQRRTSRVKDKV
jgi:Icc-related predicted phosphoesterase